jgi:hypothetical protein
MATPKQSYRFIVAVTEPRVWLVQKLNVRSNEEKPQFLRRTLR